MKEKIENLIAFHREAKEEIFEVLNEMNSMDSSKMSVEDKEAFKTSKIQLEKELEIRCILVSDLESLKD